MLCLRAAHGRNASNNPLDAFFTTRVKGPKKHPRRIGSDLNVCSADLKDHDERPFGKSKETWNILTFAGCFTPSGVSVR
jgi:hypothetical protein